MQVRKVSFDQQPEIDEFVEQIEGQTFCLVPDAQYTMVNLNENKYGYKQLNQVCQAQFKRPEVLRETEFNDKLHMLLKGVLPKDLCEMFINQAKTDPTAMYHSNLMTSLLPLILTDEIDSLLCSYFRSEYTMFWYSYLQTDKTVDSVSNLWHCDGAPQNYVKILIYLNKYEDHLGNTKFMEKTSTQQLKDVGYIYGNVDARTNDLSGLAKAKNLNLDEVMYEAIEAGDGLLFNPTLIAHRGKIPVTGTRHVLQLCFLPSPYHWQFTKEQVLPIRSMDFDKIATTLLNHVQQQEQQAQKQSSGEHIIVPSDGAITSAPQLKFLLNNIFPTGVFAHLMYFRLIEADPKLQHINTITALIETLKGSFKGSVNWNGSLGVQNMNNLLQLAKYEAEFKDSINRYATKDKARSSGIFWPSPVHPDKPSSKYETLPYMVKHPIMDMKTPIGSAGSCFAFEIARVFQEKGYNYVITERNDDVSSGLAIDGYTPGDKHARFCANYGILFNTPSFRQLAERAFNLKPTPQIIFQQPSGGWVDPYRENVLFYSHEAYVNDYEQHIAACRKSLEQCEVFIITLGLNECWEFRDGTVMSRNPRDNMYPLVKHKTLTVQENVDNIQTFFNIVKQHNPHFKLIISVSPIPFLATGRAKEHHIISANTHSKSVLRVAAQTLVESNPDIYYLPSYELVMECIKDAWGDDHRHVKPATVEKVVEMFKEIFIKPSETQ
jgi:hypothetical protein